MTARLALISALAALLVLPLAACGRDEKPLASGPAPPSIAHRVWVLGGDALIIDGRHYRLSNAFAPESVPAARCWAEALASQMAIQKVKELVRNAGSITVEATGGHDEYNRAYARVSLDGLDLGETLFQRGLGARPPKGRFEWCNPLSVETNGAPDWHAYGETGRP